MLLGALFTWGLVLLITSGNSGYDFSLTRFHHDNLSPEIIQFDFTVKKTDKFNQTIPQVERFGDSKICEIIKTYYPQLQNLRSAE